MHHPEATERSTRTFHLYLVTLCVLLVAGIGAVLWSGPFRLPDELRYRDFLVYHSALRALDAGANPYDQDAVEQIERAAGYVEADRSLPFHYPPYFLALVAPVVRLPLDQAAAVWLCLNVFFFLLAGGLAWRLCCRERFEPLLCAALSLVAIPITDALLEGQVTGALSVGVVLVLVAMVEDCALALSVAAALLALKLHLFLPFLSVVAYDLVRKGRVRSIVCAPVVVLALSAGMEWFAPGIHSRYALFLSNGLPSAPTASLPSVVLESFPAFGPPTPGGLTLPALVASLVAVLIARRRAMLDWCNAGPLLLAASLVLAPRAWVSDLAAGTVAQVLVVATLWREHGSGAGRRAAAAFLLVQVGFFAALLLVPGRSMVHFAAYPPLLLAGIWLIQRWGAGLGRATPTSFPLE